MNTKRASATVLATALTIGAVSATAPAVAEPNNPLSNAAQAAFDWWAPKLMESDPLFSIPELAGGGKVKWALPVTGDMNLIDAATQSVEGFADKLGNPPKISELTGGVDTITPAVADDGTLVAVLPFGKASVDRGQLRLSDLVSGALVQATEHEDSQVPIAAPDKAIRLLYEVVSGGKSITSGFDMVDSARPAVSVSDLELSYDSPKNEGLPYLPITNLNITPINPDTENTIKQIVKIVNNQPGDVTSIVEVLRTPTDGETGDKDKGGLVPVTNSDGKPISDATAVEEGKTTVKHRLSFTSPAEGEQVYINHRVVDDAGNDVVQPDMRTLSAMKPTLDVQASSQDGNRKLAGHGKQTIYNQAKVHQLTPGKPYQVLVNLSQCNPTNGCTEVAAVNREIIPQDTTERTENFSVDIDTTNISSNETFEWTTSVFAGTGDVKNMGEKLVAVDDHPSSQVLSFSGDGTSLNTTAAGTRKVDHTSATATKTLEIEDKQPPVPMEQVRENNEQLDAEHADSTNTVWLIGGSVALITALAGGLLMFRRRNATRED